MKKYFSGKSKNGADEKYYGLVDIGSNTVHGVVYREKKSGGVKKVLNQKDSTELISYVNGGYMSDEGIERLCDVISELTEIFRMMKCEKVDFFATSALRNLKNSEEVTEAVYMASGVRMRIISWEEEAMYDFVALKKNCADENGTGLDLGGGSAQLVEMRNGGLTESSSFECGCLRMYNNYVKGVIPFESERRFIENKVVRLIEEDGRFKKNSVDTLYLMGGSARAIGKFHRSISGESKNCGRYFIEKTELDRIMKMFKEDESFCIYTVNRLFPDRICTFVPGVIIIKTIAEYLGVQQFCILKDGIREGVLYHEFIK